MIFENSMRKTIIKLLFLIIIVISILGLIYINYQSDINAINNINVSLNKVDVNDIKITSFKLNFNVEIFNPSDRDIIDLSTDFNIYIENNYVGEGNFSNINIPNKTNLSKDIIITVFYDGLADATVDVIKKILNEGEFKIEIKGTLYAKALFGLSLIEQNYIASKIYK